MFGYKSIVVAIVLGTTLGLLSGCGTIRVATGQAETVGVSEDLHPALRAAQGTVNEGNVLLSGTQRTIRQFLTDDILTATEAMDMYSEAVKLGRRLDEIQVLIDVGDLSAKDQAELLQDAITVLHRKVAEKRREAQ